MKTIIEMARKYTVGGLEFDLDGLKCFVDAIRADEREACAKVCDARAIEYDGFTEEQNASEKLAAAIRARGQA